VPTVLPNTDTETDIINGLSELSSSGKFSSAKGGENLFCDLIVKGFVDAGFGSPEEAAETVEQTWRGYEYLEQKTYAWERLQEYYNK